MSKLALLSASMLALGGAQLAASLQPAFAATAPAGTSAATSEAVPIGDLRCDPWSWPSGGTVPVPLPTCGGNGPFALFPVQISDAPSGVQSPSNLIVGLGGTITPAVVPDPQDPGPVPPPGPPPGQQAAPQAPVLFNFDNSDGLGGINQTVAYGDFPAQAGSTAGFANGVFQPAVGNTASVIQQSALNRGIIQQGGSAALVSGNSATISQGTSGPLAALNNVALISQQTDANTASILQEGSYGFAALFQAGPVAGASASINQYNSGSAPDFSFAEVTGIYIRISGSGSGGSADASNFASIFQTDDSVASIEQGTAASPSFGNVAQVFQRGATDSASINQGGNQNFAIVDQGTGAGNVARISQPGNQNYAQALQSGSGNVAETTQSGTGSSSIIIQSGSQNRATVRQ